VAVEREAMSRRTGDVFEADGVDPLARRPLCPLEARYITF
jgi:hypothetical protein